MKRKLALMLLCTVMTITAWAQSAINGTVVNAGDGEPIIGATVKVKGATQGTVTDVNGKFSINASAGKTLVVSYIGMVTKEVAAKNGMVVELGTDETMLDEVMVVAYGTSKKSSFTGSASTVDSKKLELRPITSVTNGLEGQTTGVLMTSASGQPGSSASIRIRGYGSINASSTPLYVVDGAPYDGSLSDINPADIESMTVLKDASAGALYGARGANGVVMITTKQGKEGKVNVNWRSSIGWSTRANKPYDMCDAKEFAQLSYEAIRNSYLGEGYAMADAEAAARAELGGANYLGGGAGELYNPFKNYTFDTLINPQTGKVQEDAVAAWDEKWMDNLLQTGFRHNHELSLNGGTNKTKYMFSLGYLNEEGILKTTGYQRYTGRANVTSEVNDWFKANLGASLTGSTQNFSDYDGSSTSNPWYSSQFVSPLFPVYLRDLNGNFALDADGNKQLDYGESGRPGSYTDFNPLGGLTLDKSQLTNDAATLRTGVTFGGDSQNLGWAQGLKLNINFSLDYRTQNQYSYMNNKHGNQATAGGLLEKINTRTRSYTFNQLLTYDRTFAKKHTINLLAGHEFYDMQYQYLSAAKTNIVDGIFELRAGSTIFDADSYSHKYRIESWLGRVNYNFDDKYYFSASLRTDGSSRFHQDNRWGTFWSVGANWRVKKENFLKDVEWLDNLSVKASYGEQGNDALGTYYAWQSLYSLSYANGNNLGALISTLENKNISWEKNGNLNLGVEATFFGSRLNVNVEYFNKKTTDMLLNYPMALSTGFSGYDANVGDMRNSGVEAEVRGTIIKHGDFVWNVNVMGSVVKNKVLHLTSESPEIISGVRSIKEGMPIYTFYLAKSAGVDPQTGTQLYWAYKKDDNGDMIPGSEYITSDYTVANSSKYYQGSRIPDLHGSIGTDLSWKGISLSVLTTYSLGGKVFDGTYQGTMNTMYYNNNWNKHALRRWQQPGDVTDVPRIEVAGSSIATDQYLIDASYFAIKNITLSYQLPRNIIGKAGLNSVRVFGSVDNVCLFTHLNGMDPQYNFNGGTDYVYTPNRTWALGLEVNF